MLLSSDVIQTKKQYEVILIQRAFTTFREWSAPPCTDGRLIFPRVVFCIMDSSMLCRLFFASAVFYCTTAFERKAVFACANRRCFEFHFETLVSARVISCRNFPFRLFPRFNYFIVLSRRITLTAALKRAALLSILRASSSPVTSRQSGKR